VFTEHGTSLVDEVFGAEVPRHLVLLHGWGLNRDSLRGIGILFERRFRVHLIDLPGFGDAASPPSDWDTTMYARLVEHYLVERVAGAVVLVGHSFGGRVAVRIAASRPAWLQAVVLLAVPGLPATGWSRAQMRRAAIRTLRRLLVLLKPVTGPGLLLGHTNRFGSKDYLAADQALRPILVRARRSPAARSCSCTGRTTRKHRSGLASATARSSAIGPRCMSCRTKIITCTAAPVRTSRRFSFDSGSTVSTIPVRSARSRIWRRV
jgi:pimeloyl-ACP methyl ester carboxylesterase